MLYDNRHIGGEAIPLGKEFDSTTKGKVQLATIPLRPKMHRSALYRQFSFDNDNCTCDRYLTRAVWHLHKHEYLDGEAAELSVV